MLVQYTPISSLTPEQLTRLSALMRTARDLQEGQGHFLFEGMALLKSDIAAHFPRGGQKKPPQPLFG